MTNIHVSPNSLHVSAHHAYTCHFGAPYAVQRIHPVTGAGHVDHIRVSFHGGLTMDLSIPCATELTRRLPEMLAESVWPDVSGSVAEVEGL